MAWDYECVCYRLPAGCTGDFSSKFGPSGVDQMTRQPANNGGGKLAHQEAAMDSSLVSSNPEVMSGALCFSGTRVLVKNLFDYLEGGSSLEDFLQDFPSIQRGRAVAVLEAARERLSIDAPAA